MLRASIDTHEQSVNLDAIMNGNLDESSSNVAYANELIAFANSIVSGSPQQIATAREQLVKSAGPDAMVDAAGVASNFQRMVRIADATGIELGDAQLAQASTSLRSELQIEQFRSEDKQFY